MDKKIYTVSELTTKIKLLIEMNLSDIWVEGEISNFKSYPSGHLYFDLKDEGGVLPAVMFNGRDRLKFKPEDGMKVIANGRASAYQKSGKYQLIVEALEPAGLGALYQAFEQLKVKLKAEGLFDQEHKRPIPPFPDCIGIITSIKGAAIRDMLRTITERFPVPRIIIYPAQVQGEGAAEDIAEAIRELNGLDEEIRPDVIIAGRGGGSIEDLWAFNEEPVARAIYGSEIPVISAVGHETDYTIADFVADVRALTPTDTGKRVVAKSKRELKDDLEKGWVVRLQTSMEHSIETEKARLDSLCSMLRTLHPKNRMEFYQQQLDSLDSELNDIIGHYMSVTKEEVKNLYGKLMVLNPEAILERGYSITFLLPEHGIVMDAGKVNKEDEIEIKVKKGIIRARVE